MTPAVDVMLTIRPPLFCRTMAFVTARVMRNAPRRVTSITRAQSSPSPRAPPAGPAPVRGAPEPFELLAGALEPLRVAARDYHGRSVLGQRRGDRRADAAAAAPCAPKPAGG